MYIETRADPGFFSGGGGVTNFFTQFSTDFTDLYLGFTNFRLIFDSVKNLGGGGGLKLVNPPKKGLG
jgi:hypothetical protein